MRPEVTITNKNKRGQVTSNWFVRVGREFRIFTDGKANPKAGVFSWGDEGLGWINAQLANPASGENPENEK